MDVVQRVYESTLAASQSLSREGGTEAENPMRTVHRSDLTSSPTPSTHQHLMVIIRMSVPPQ